MTEQEIRDSRAIRSALVVILSTLMCARGGTPRIVVEQSEVIADELQHELDRRGHFKGIFGDGGLL